MPSDAAPPPSPTAPASTPAPTPIPLVLGDHRVGSTTRKSPRTARERLRAGFPLVNDHPDVAGLLRDPEMLALLGPALAEPYQRAGITIVAAPEARGPILGALAAVELGAGLVLVRKDDRNHPGADRRVESAPTWRGTSEVFQTRSFDLSPADRVLVVDDWVTTGSSLAAIRSLVHAAGATYVGAAVLVRKATDATCADLAVESLVDFDDLVSPPA